MKSATLRILPLALGACLFGAGLFGASTARAVPFDNRPKILLHVKTLTTKNQCTTWGNLTDCTAAVTRAQVGSAMGPFYYVYALVATGPYRSVGLGGNDLGIAGAQFGIHYDNAANSGVDIFTWTLCATLEFTSSGFPASGGGDLITWDSVTKCQKSEVAIAGYFYCGAYSADVFSLTPRPVDAAVKIADCNSQEAVLTTQDLGQVIFSTAGTSDGCNPCDQLCGAPAGLLCSSSGFPTSGNAPLTTFFTSSASGGTPPYSYAWNFGDGSATSFAQNPSHVYTLVGTYLASVTISDSSTPVQTCSGSSISITVGAPTIFCSASGTPGSGTAPLTVGFTGNASGGTPPFSYVWNFGDGATSSLQNPSHTYATGGNYTATFTVFDSALPVQQTCSSSVFTSVAAPPPPDFKVVRPNGGETWLAGSSVTVEWTASSAADLAISYDAGATWTNLQSSVGSAGSHQVTLLAPWVATPAALFRVSRSGQPITGVNFDVSDAVFRIVTSTTPPPAAARLQSTRPGEASSDWLGYAVTGIGDFDGDGFTDYAAGAPLNMAGGDEAGRVYVYFGGVSGASRPPLVLTGAASERFGWSIASAGDVNGDGYDDLLVGAPASGVGGDTAGQAYLFLGGATPNASADLVFAHSGAGDSFGMAVGSAGDLNNDGFSDLVVGAPFRDLPFPDCGAAYVYLGGPAPDATVDLLINGLEAQAGFGLAVGSAGDLNGDSYDDFVVGAPLRSAGAVDGGRAWVFLGGAAPDGVADLILTGVEMHGEQGHSLLAAGDLNGDGFSDLAIGAPAKSNGASPGHVLVYFGGNTPDDVADLTLTGAQPIDGFGTALGAGDFNGDGIADLLVGAPFNDAGGLEAGRAYLYYGSLVPDAEPDFVWTGLAAGDEFGWALAAAGDVNGDGFPDAVVGAPYNDAGGEDAGACSLFDLNRFHLLSPRGGDLWNVGASQTISWLGAAPADLLLSVDGGRSYDRLATNVGGKASNIAPVRVPHSPTRFARLEVRPTDTGLNGRDVSDSLFTIQSSVSLLAFRAEPGNGGTLLTWSTDPGVEPDGLAGYRLYRAPAARPGAETRIGADILLESTYRDATGQPGDRYRLAAVNGLGDELELGSLTSLMPFVGLRAWPSPARVGTPVQLTLSAPGIATDLLRHDLDIGVFDLRGRRVATINPDQATPASGALNLVWNGRDSEGRPVVSGIYFIRAHNGNPVVRIEAQQRIALVR